MSATNLTAGFSNLRLQDAALPLQPILAPHPADRHANVDTGPKENLKTGLPMVDSTFALRLASRVSVYRHDTPYTFA